MMFTPCPTHRPPDRLARWASAALACGLLAAVGPSQASPAAAPTGGARAPAVTVTPAPSRAARPQVGCLIGPERVADIGSPVTGIVSRMGVERGDKVKRGQVLVQLENGVEQAGVQAASARADIDADIRAAQASADLARQKHERAAGLVKEGFISPQAVDQARAERDMAEQKLAQAQAQKNVQGRELEIVRAQLGQRSVKAPFAGVVIERFVNDGERVEDKPMLRLAQVHPLRVDLVVPATRWGSVQVGDGIEIQPELPGVQPVQAKVNFVDTVIDAASNTFLVRLALPNPDYRLPAGARCRVDAALASPPAAPTAQPVGGAKAPAAAPAQSLAQRSK